jgi:flagellar biosynthesis/type III secretory pathway protein FliH
MLSKIVRSEQAEELELKPFVLPTHKELGLIIAKKKQQIQGKKLCYKQKNDTVNAAGKEADAETSLLIKQKEQEIRRQLEKEYQAKLIQQVKQVQQNYTNSLEELTTSKQILYNKSEDQLVDLVFSIVRKVIASEIEATPEVVLGMLKRSFDCWNKQEIK